MFLTEEALTPAIKEFMVLGDLPLMDYESDPNDWFLDQFGLKTRIELRDASLSQDPYAYELIWQTKESMQRFFWHVSAASLLSLPYLSSIEIVKGKVLDLGSGMGFTSCFMALNWPDCHVTAVELTENGNIRAHELAEKLGLTNITFVNQNLGDFEADTKFDLITSFLTAHELGSLNSLQEIYGSRLQEEEFASLNLEKYRSPYAVFLVELLSDVGHLFSVERLPDPVTHCAWLGALQNAGIVVNLDKSLFTYPFLPTWGHRERLPVFVGTHGRANLSSNDFFEWYFRYPFGQEVE